MENTDKERIEELEKENVWLRQGYTIIYDHFGRIQNEIADVRKQIQKVMSVYSHQKDSVD